MPTSRFRIAVVIVALLLASTLLYAVSLYFGSPKRADSVIIIIKKSYFDRLYELLGLGEPHPYVLWATLTLPRTGVLLPAEAKIIKDNLYFKFNDEIISNYLSREDNSPALPTVHLVIADYRNNKLFSIDISSLTLAEIESLIMKGKRLSTTEKLRYNDYKYLLFERKIVLNSASAQLMLYIGDVIVKDIPEVPSIEEILNVSSPSIDGCPEGQHIERFWQGIMRIVNDDIVEAVGLQVPGWWEERYVEADGDSRTNASWAWHRYVVDLLASTYLIDVEYFGSLERGLGLLTRTLLHQDRMTVEGADEGLLWLSAVYMEEYVLDDHWSNTLTGEKGFIEVDPSVVESMRIWMSQVSLEASPEVIERNPGIIVVHGNYVYARGSTGTVGLMMTGTFFAAEELVQTRSGEDIVIIGPDPPNTAFSLMANLSSLVYGPDAIIVWWNVALEEACGNYVLVRPVTVFTPIFMIEPDFSTLAFEKGKGDHTWLPPSNPQTTTTIKITFNSSIPRHSVLWKWSTLSIYDHWPGLYDAVLIAPLQPPTMISLPSKDSAWIAETTVITNITALLLSIGISKITDNSSFLHYQVYIVLGREPDAEYSLIITWYPADWEKPGSPQPPVSPAALKIFINHSS